MNTQNTEHTITYIVEGSGMSECHTPVYTCGWKGRGLEAYNDWKWSILNDQKKEHLDSVKNS